MVNNDVASLTSGLGSDNTLSGDNLSSEGSLVLVNIDRNSRLIIIRLGLKEVLLGIECGAVVTERERNMMRSAIRASSSVSWSVVAPHNDNNQTRRDETRRGALRPSARRPIHRAIFQ